VAKTLKRPFYVAVESYKFARMYPLSQRDVTDMCVCSAEKANNNINEISNGSTEISKSSLPSISALTLEQPMVDFTPAEYITLLFTDLGVLTPAAVSDELIRLYQ
jgi:translation initiation factor eIF-2B subunit alpha